MRQLEEEYLSKKRVLELYDKKILNKIEIAIFEGLRQIHYYLFQDVFPHEGKI